MRNKPRWMEVFLRALGLSLLWNASTKLFRRPRVELPKQAMRKNRFLATATTATHVIPLAAVTVLLRLNIQGYYIGGELAGASGYDDLKFSGLQVAAKLHELTMLASLSLTVVSFVRHELAFGQGIPFGAIVSSLQFASISHLWSKEFAGTFKASFRSRSRNIRIVLLIFVGSFLAVTVGPSSAIAMRPRSDKWPAGGSTFYLNATRDQMWPTLVDDSVIPKNCADVSLDMDCISDAWYTLSDGLIPFLPSLSAMKTTPDFFSVISPKSVRQLYTRQPVGLYRAQWTLATTQMSNLGDAVAELGRLWNIAAWNARTTRFKYRKNVFYRINDVQQPVTMAKCITMRSREPGSFDLQSDKLQIPQMESSCIKDNPVMVGSNDTAWQSQFTSFLNVTTPTLRFIDLPKDTFGENTVGALISLPETWPGGKNVIGCGVDARWFPAYIESTRNQIKVVSGAPGGWETLGTCGLSGPRNITVSSQWANYLNPNLVESNLTAFHTLLKTIPTSYAKQWTKDHSFVEPLIESIISILITNGLARTAFSAAPQGTLKGCTSSECRENCDDGESAWCQAILPKKQFGGGGEVYNLAPGTDTSKMADFTVEVFAEGWAYNSRGKAAKMSCIVLAVYAILALFHIGFTVWTGMTSQAWDTLSEVIALAMQSRPTETLRNTSAGITTATVFTQMVRVVQTGENGDHLELDFGDFPDASKLPLVPNEFYE